MTETKAQRLSGFTTLLGQIKFLDGSPRVWQHLHMSGSKNVLEQRLANLRNQIQLVVNDLSYLAAEVASGDSAASHFIDRLRIATDNATGCALLADARLSAPVAAVTRSMLESLVTTHWASLSDANAEEI